MNKEALHRLWKAMEEFRKLQPEIPLQTAMTFIYVTTHEGCTMKELQDALGVSQASSSRNVAALGKEHRLGKPGLDLLVAEPDPTEPRRLIVKMTPRGRRIVETMSDYMESQHDNRTP